MGDEWRTATVRQLVDEGVLDRPMDGNHGEIHPKEGDFVGRGIPFIMASDVVRGRVDTEHCAFIREEQARSLRKGFSLPGDVLISHKATMGRTAIVGGLGVPFLMLTPQVTYYRVRDDSSLNARYLKYYFDSPAFQGLFEAWGQKGSTRAYLGITAQLDLPIVLPPVAEQRTIAHILGALDDKIELNRRMAETLEAMARALFKSWFVDFDPVHAKAEGRPTGLADDLAALFPTALDDAGKPEGWTTAVASIADLVRNSIHPSEVASETGYVGLEHIEPKRLGLQSWGAASEVDSVKTAFRRGNLLFGKLRPYFHKVCIAPFDGICSSEIFVFRPAVGIPASYLYLAFSEASFVATASAAPSGTRMPRADWRYMAQKSAIRPTVELLKAFDTAVSPGLKRLQLCTAESRSLTALRDALLPRLISGELRIRDAESAIEAA